MKKRFGALRNIVDARATRAKVLAMLDDLPSSPAVAAEISRIVADPDSSIKDIESRVTQDQALVAKLLRLVNSSYYGLSRPVTLLAHAITLAGTKTIRNLVFAVTTSPLLEKNLPAYGYAKLGLWTHSITTAVAAPVIGSLVRLRSIPPDELFVVGLLHDVGKLILGEFMVKVDAESVEMLAAGGRRCMEKEREMTDFDHAELGSTIAQKWNMSPMLSTLIAHHHDPAAAGEYAEGAMVVELADTAARILKSGLADEGGFNGEIDPAIQAHFQLDEGFWDVALEGVREEIELRKNLFEIQGSR